MNKFEKVSFEQYKKDDQFEPIDMEDKSEWDADDWASWEEGLKDEYEEIKLPKRATTGSAGYDIFAPYPFSIPPYETRIIPTGIRVIIDDDKFLAIYPRSGLGFKCKMQLYNTVGIIDSDYCNSDNEGHIWVKFYNDSPDGKTIRIDEGEAMCQGIIQQYFKTDDDDADGERNGGFGSTDKK